MNKALNSIIKNGEKIKANNKIAAQAHLNNLKSALETIYKVIGNNDSIAYRYKRTCERLQQDIEKTQYYQDTIWTTLSALK